MSIEIPIATATNRPFQDLFEIYEFSSSSLNPSAERAAVLFLRDYNFICIRRGAPELYIDSHPCSIDSNSIYCIRPGQQFAFTSTAPVNGIVVSFEAEFIDLHEKQSTDLILESLFTIFHHSPPLKFQDDACVFMTDLAAKMLEEFKGHADYKKEILQGLLKIFIIHTTRVVQNINQGFIPTKKAAIVKQFYLLLENHFSSKKKVRDYAIMLSVSSGYLNEVVHEISGITASQHIQKRIVREAKRRIIFYRSSMKEISISLGFSDQAHFSKYFKNISGKTFSAFKKEITS